MASVWPQTDEDFFKIFQEIFFNTFLYITLVTLTKKIVSF